MLDLGECDVNRLSDLPYIFNLLNTLPDEIGMTRITQPYVFPYEGLVPDDEGITGTVIIAESHISVHTFPRKKYCFVDLFSCKTFDVDRARERLIEAFGSRRPEVHLVQRGSEFPRGMLVESAAEACTDGSEPMRLR
ncbi:MAG: S-adenosylmethionine decarboxylase [bacterium]|nr:S-adenosylmethionine decarboxylase [bacterium]